MKRSPVGLTLEEERHFPSCWGLAWVGIVPFIGVVLGCVASLEGQEKGHVCRLERRKIL